MLEINVKQSLCGTLSSKAYIGGSITAKEAVSGLLGISTDGVTEQYNGNYTVIPAVDSQVLPTKRKVMVDDLTITKIPFFEVSNTSGGTTVYIGEEIEYG